MKCITGGSLDISYSSHLGFYCPVGGWMLAGRRILYEDVDDQNTVFGV